MLTYPFITFVTRVDEIAMNCAAPHDSDPQETAEWLDALTAAFRHGGAERARYLLQQLEGHAQELGMRPQPMPYSAYENTIPLDQQGS